MGVSEGASAVRWQRGQGVDDQWRRVGQLQPDVDQDCESVRSGVTHRLGGSVQDAAAGRRR